MPFYVCLIIFYCKKIWLRDTTFGWGVNSNTKCSFGYFYVENIQINEYNIRGVYFY